MSNDPFGFEAIKKPGRWWPHDELVEHDREVAEKERDRLVEIAENYTLGTVQGKIARLGIVAAMRRLPDDAGDSRG